MKKSVKVAATLATALVFAVVILPAVAICMIFPNKYASSVSAAADEFGLSRSLVKSVVWAESRYDPKAVSKSGAKGLMQLMPETFDMCASALGMPDADIFGMDVSLRCGCYYLSLLIDKFDGDAKAALMAYNAGEANAKKFLDGADIFPETKSYLRNIGRAQKVYRIFD